MLSLSFRRSLFSCLGTTVFVDFAAFPSDAREWIRILFAKVGLSSGFIQAFMEFIKPEQDCLYEGRPSALSLASR